MKRVCSVILVLLILASFALPVAAAAEESESVIRVGWFAQSGYMEKDEAGNYRGYNYEYLKAISRNTGWQYRFVEGDFTELYEKLRRGEIDIMGCVFPSEQRRQEVSFPKYRAGEEYISLFTRNESTLAENDFDAFDGLRAGVTTSENRARFEQFSAENGFSCTITNYPNYDALQAAMESGAVDVGVSGGQQPVEKFRTVARFSPSDFYFAVSPNNMHVLHLLNSAMETVLTENPYFNSTLSEKYLENSKSYFFLTTAEKQLISTLPTLTVAYTADWTPFDMQDETGSFTGILADAYREIASLTGLRFNFVKMKAEDVSGADILASTEQSFASAAKLNIR